MDLLGRLQKNGSWGKAELVKDAFINLHVASSALNYGQSVSCNLSLISTA